MMNSAAFLSVFNNQPLDTVLVVLIIFVGVNLLLLYPLLRLTAYIVYLSTMVRKNEKCWDREWYHPDEESCRMHDEGVEWAKAHADCMTEVKTVSEDGLELYGEYYDFGHDRAVIIIPGRTDNLVYSYYYAKPYSDNGYNVLCIDQRAHGKSEGKYVTTGFAESRDAIKWIKLLEEDHGVKSVVIHGICIGSACGLYTMLAEDAPESLSALVADGMYCNFYESYYLHMKDLGKPTFIMGIIESEMKKKTGYGLRRGPADVIGKYEKPLLMLHGTGDIYSLPARTNEMFDKCPSENKKLVWFEDGRHSKLRIVYPERYDGAIADFLATLEAHVSSSHS